MKPSGSSVGGAGRSQAPRQDGAAIWLETTDPVDPPIYERFDFETVTHIEDAAWLPGLWVMRREAMNGKRSA